MRGFTADVVEKYRDNHVVPNVVSNREEVFALSDMKRVLAQSSDYAEFSQAFVDFAEGVSCSLLMQTIILILVRSHCVPCRERSCTSRPQHRQCAA
jgi:hypothetical protein